MGIVQTQNFTIAERKYFSGHNDRWAMRNAIKQHPMRQYVRLEALFTELLRRANHESPDATAEYCAVIAASKLLHTLDCIK